MTKQIGIADEIYEKLKKLKNDKEDSFSKVIGRILEGDIEKDVVLEEINNCFTKLKLLVPNLQESIEYMRAVTIRFYKLSPDDQKMKAKELNNIVIDSFNEIINMIKEVENEH